MEEKSEQPVIAPGAILTYRPDGMKFEDYRSLLRIQRLVMRKKLRGRTPDRKIAQMMPVRFGYNAHTRS
jgi:hypothetical protein